MSRQQGRRKHDSAGTARNHRRMRSAKKGTQRIRKQTDRDQQKG